MAKLLFLVIGMGVCNSWASDLVSVTPGSDHGYFSAVYLFSEPLTEKNVSLEFHDNGVEFNLSGVKLLTDKNLMRVDQDGIKSILTVKKDEETTRSRVFLTEDIGKSTVKDSIRWKIEGSTLKLLVKKPSEEWSMAALGIETIAPTAVDEDFLRAAAAPVVAEVETAPVQSKTKSKPILEKDIPVLTGTAAKTKASSSPITRVVLSLLIIVGLGFGAIAFSRWYGKTYRKDVSNNKIRVLTQHHLGPRKSLAIIRVAGETILIGVTDQNISMIKSLSLLDDHIPDFTPKSFAESIQASDEVSQEQVEDDFVIGGIKDRITAKIKDLRPLG